MKIMILGLSYMIMFGCISFAMEIVDPVTHDDVDLHIAVIGGQINQQILGIADNKWYTSVVSSIKSFCYSASHRQEAIEQLCTVESVISKASDFNNFPLLFEKLQENHWHFSYLVRALVNNEVEQLPSVKGSNIDTLTDVRRIIPGLSQELSTFIHASATERYKKEMKLDQSLR